MTIDTFSINGKLELIGPGADVLTIFGSGSHTIFRINDGGIVTISGLTITNGGPYYGIENLGTLIINGCNISKSGYGIFSSGNGTKAFVNLTVNNSTLSENSHEGIISTSATLTVNNSTLSNNNGNGISNSNGPLIINNSTISKNSKGGSSGGVYNYGGRLTIDSCDITGNQPGSGIISVNNLDEVIITNSTISNNGVAGCGGGINLGINKKVTLSNNTISENIAVSGGGLCIEDNAQSKVFMFNTTVASNTATNHGPGGGVYIGNGATLIIGNSLVAGNNAFSDGVEIYNHPYNPLGSNSNAFTSMGHNLFGQNGVSGLTNANPAANDRILPGAIGTAIGPLANNGGPTLTYLPVAGGPAIDAGDNALAQSAGLTTDQRGAGFPRIVGGAVDIGAVEVGNPPSAYNPIHSDFDGDGRDDLAGLNSASAIVSAIHAYDLRGGNPKSK